ncbi:MAG: porin family protein [Bacteroidetes bacterium]|nr:porin family protein [Bacteroidota bacterium]
MKKLFIIFFVLLLAVPAEQLLAQKGVWSIGIEGGPGLSLIYGSESVYSHSKPALSGAAGIFGEYGFAPHFSAKLALEYERISTFTDNHSALLPTGGRLRYNLDYISLPLLVKWHTGRGIGFFVNAGPSISMLLQESLWYYPDTRKEKAANETNAYHLINLAATAGVGITVPVWKRILLSLEVRDNLGVLNIRSGTSEFERNSYFSAGATKGYTNSTLLLVDFCYQFGGYKGLPCSPNDPDFQYIHK